MSISGGLLVMCGAASAEWAGPILDKASEKLFGGAAKRVLEQLQARIRAHTGELPVNHDLERSIRLAELTSTLMVLAAYRHQVKSIALTRAALCRPFIKAAHDWLLEQVNTSLEVSGEFHRQHIAFLARRIVARCAMDGVHRAVGKGLGIQARRRFGVFVIPEADCVLGMGCSSLPHLKHHPAAAPSTASRSPSPCFARGRNATYHRPPRFPGLRFAGTHMGDK